MGVGEKGSCGVAKLEKFSLDGEDVLRLIIDSLSSLVVILFF